MVKAVEVVWADWKKAKCPECRRKLQIYSWHIAPEYTTYELYCGRCLTGYFKNSYERLEELK